MVWSRGAWSAGNTHCGTGVLHDEYKKTEKVRTGMEDTKRTKLMKKIVDKKGKKKERNVVLRRLPGVG